MSEFTAAMKQIEPQGPVKACVIWLHGLGATADDFVPAVPYLKLAADAGVRFLFPQAPERAVSINGGWQMPAWYDITKMLPEREIVPEHLHDAARGLHALSQQQIADGVPADKIFWIGFSQGGAVVLEAALNGGRYPSDTGDVVTPAAVMALSTYQALEADQPHPGLAELNFWHGHGAQDDVVPFAMGKKAARLTAEKAADSQWHTYPMAHEVCIAQLEAMGAYIGQKLS